MRYIKGDSWFTRHILRRSLWLLVVPMAILVAPLSLIKSAILLYHKEFTRAFFTAITSIVFPLFAVIMSLAAFFMPTSFRNYAMKLLYLPAMKHDEKPAPNMFQNIAVTDKGIIDNTELAPLEASQRYTIYCCPNGASYQHVNNCEIMSIHDEVNRLQRNIRYFNYPGVANGSAPSSSSSDLINAGIAQIYQLAEKHQWSNQDISKNVFLFGYSMGGGVAFKIAEYFKLKYKIDLPIYAHNSYSSISNVCALFLCEAGLPLWYAKLFAPIVLNATSQLEIDSLAACKNLNPDMIHFSNIGPHKNAGKNSWIGSLVNADWIIRDEATLTFGLTRATTHILRRIAANEEHLLYPIDTSFTIKSKKKFPHDLMDREFYRTHHLSLFSLKDKDNNSGFENYCNIVNNHTRMSNN